MSFAMSPRAASSRARRRRAPFALASACLAMTVTSLSACAAPVDAADDTPVDTQESASSGVVNTPPIASYCRLHPTSPLCHLPLLPTFGAGSLAASKVSSLPLLVIYVNWVRGVDPAPETLAHPTSYYEQRLFGPGFPNAADYFRETSGNRFTFSKLRSVGPINVPIEVNSSPDQPYVLSRVLEHAIGPICGQFSSWSTCWNTVFAPLDRNHDGSLDPLELSVMVISRNAGRIAGANRGLENGCVAVADLDAMYGRICSFPKNQGIIEIEDEAEFDSFTHEMGHNLDLPDIYGVNGDYGISLMGPTINWWGTPADDQDSIYVDGALRLKLGWLKPRVIDVASLAPGASASVSWTTTDTQDTRAVIVYDSSVSSDEFYLIEHRDPANAYDHNVSSLGYEVWHVLNNTDVATHVGSNPPGFSANLLHASDGTKTYAIGTTGYAKVTATTDYSVVIGH